MEDMQKMIERYKKELLEYSKASTTDSAAASSRFPSASSGDTPKKPSVIGYISEDRKKELDKNDIPIKIPEELIESVTEKPAEEKKPVDTAVIPAEDKETVTYEVNDSTSNTENADNTNNNNGQNNGDPASDPADGETETYDRPMFTQIPSFEETREQITDESVKKENIPTENASGVNNNSATAKRPEFGDNDTVSNEKAERLTEQPISGTNEGEQLTGRNFEDMRIVQNDPDDAMRQDGSQTKPIDYPKPVYDTIEEFEENNKGRGTILFRVYTAREALPVRGAVCRITKNFDGKPFTFYTLVTDESGQTIPKPLPAPSKTLSQNSENKIQPFALYDAIVSRDGYADVEFREIPVFDGVSSVQQVGMVPVPSISIKREEDENAR